MYFRGCVQVLFTVVPLVVTCPAMLRAAPRWGRYSSITAGIVCNVALQAVITAACAWPARGDRYIWRSSRRRISSSWVLLATHIALVRAVFWLRRRIMAQRASMAGGVALAERV